MGDMDEDRVYADRREETVAYVASRQGLATVRVSSDRVGRFSLAERCRARDVAARDGRVYVATDGDVLVGPDPFESTGFGDAVADAGAVAVGGDAATDGDAGMLAAAPDGTVALYRDGEWDPFGTLADVRAIDAGFLAAADGVYRVDGEDLVRVGLGDVRDVAADDVPLAATDDGLYRLANGWTREVEGRFAAVAAGAGRAHAATAERLFAREDGAWAPIDPPVDEPVVGVAYGECVYAVTDRGTFLVDADPERTPDGTGGWRKRSLGLPDVVGLAVP